MLDLLDSLVRKSLVTAEQVGGHARYGMLETIRQFAEDQLAATGTIDEVRDRHARYFAEQAVAHWDIWDGPGQRVAVDWVDAEFANLRAGFRWAADQGDLATAAAIAAHTTMLGFALQRFEPVGWAEEILAAATAADLPQLPRLYTAASLCSLHRTRSRPPSATPRPRSRWRPIPATTRSNPDGAACWEAAAHLYAGRIDRCAGDLRRPRPPSPGSLTSLGLCGMLYVLPAVGRAEEAMAIAEETVAAARAHGNPFWIACALAGYGRAFAEADPARALDALRQGLAFAREHRLAASGRRSSHEKPPASKRSTESSSRPSRCSTPPSTRSTGPATSATWPSRSPTWPCSSTASNDPRSPPPSTAPAPATATSAGSSTFPPSWTTCAPCSARPRSTSCVAAGAAMEPADAVAYARDQIQLAGRNSQPRSQSCLDSHTSESAETSVFDDRQCLPLPTC